MLSSKLSILILVFELILSVLLLVISKKLKTTSTNETIPTVSVLIPNPSHRFSDYHWLMLLSLFIFFYYHFFLLLLLVVMVIVVIIILNSIGYSASTRSCLFQNICFHSQKRTWLFYRDTVLLLLFLYFFC